MTAPDPSPPLQLSVQPITAASFAPYGWLIDVPQRPGRPINEGSSQRFDDLGGLALDAEGGAPCLAIFRASARDPRGPWRTLERHRLGTQSFVPLAGARCIVLVALGVPGDLAAGTGAEQPDPATLRAFAVGGHQGLTLHAGTWHHGLLALDDGDFVVIERRAAAVDCDVADLAVPVLLVHA
ncbi:ureidoglycolate lyase [Aquabacterium sp.]|uniref:ureidoglycolate lyase n=1 Tax=Aquabacterium sp. TaxID=1872578 RepID=UPI002C8D654B|nr:ureidoglycolate lyase [Aquabacterium sp.]HSW07644.1 ureidoglycolate lyase [Aquabacterium sp.]